MKDFNRASITWTVKEMVRLANAGKIKFDNAVQRGLVWDDGKKSLLIDSILQGYEIPPMYAKKGEGNVYDMLDGKQSKGATPFWTISRTNSPSPNSRRSWNPTTTSVLTSWTPKIRTSS